MTFVSEQTTAESPCPACGEPLVAMTGDAAVERYCVVCDFAMRQSATRSLRAEPSTGVARIPAPPRAAEPTHEPAWRRFLADTDHQRIAVAVFCYFMATFLTLAALGRCEILECQTHEGGHCITSCELMGSARTDLKVFGVLATFFGIVLLLRDDRGTYGEGGMTPATRHLWALLVTSAIMAIASVTELAGW